MWGHPHNSASPSLSNAPTGWLHPLLRASKRPFSGVPANGTYSTSHAYQFCQLTTAEQAGQQNLYKKRAPGKLVIISTLSSSTEHIKTRRRKKLHPTARSRCLVDRALHRPATTPRRHGTTRLVRVRYLAAHSPATTSAAATAIHRGPTTSQPCIQCMSSPAAERRPLHHTVTLFSGCSQHRWGRPSDITTNLGNRTTTTVRHLRHQ
jgi:hypothetical protein